MVHQRLDVPMEAVLDAYWLVREPGRDLQPERVGTDLAHHHAAAGGAEVDGGEAACHVGSVMYGWSPEEGRRDTGVDRYVQPGGARHERGAEGEDRVRAVLGQQLALEQGALGVGLAEGLLLDAVDRRALRTPATREDAGALDHAVGVDAVDLDAVLAELGGQ